MTNDVESSQIELPIACSLTGPEQARRGEEVADIFRGVQQIKELADGFAFSFSGSEA